MRVASMMMTNRYLKQLNRTYEAQTKLMEQSDGDKLHRASDDAIGYSKYLRYGDSYAENNQYQTNVKSAISWMKNSDSAIQDMSDALKTIVEKSNVAQGTNTTSDMQAIAKEMLVRVQQLVADGNTQVNGRYLFSGQSDLKQPYMMSNDKHQRGLTKSLDDKQTEFFNSGTSPSKTAKSGNLSQMLTLRDVATGDEYYLNTVDGKIYSKEFMDEG
nr:flagellar hook protein [Schwartzia sp. (in: firmicutes)]